MNDTPRFIEHDTALSLWLDDPFDPAVRSTRDKVIDHLRSRGFTCENDRGVNKLIRSNYQRGNKGALEFKMDMCGRNLKIEFFQNIVRKNPNGGEYDFDKLGKMPFLIRKQYELERNKIVALMAGLGYPLAMKQKEAEGADLIAELRGKQCHSSSPTCDFVEDGTSVYFLGWDKRWNVGAAYRRDRYMSWILLPRGEVAHNISNASIHTSPPACGMRHRHFTDDERKRKQMTALQTAVAHGEMKKIQALRALLTPADSYYVLSLKHTKREDAHITLWGQSAHGYRFGISSAGKYSREEVMAHQGYYNSGDNIAIDAETIERLVTMCDKNDRDIGASVPTLRNTEKIWRKLLQHVIAPPKYPAIPEIFTTKSGKLKKSAKLPTMEGQPA